MIRTGAVISSLWPLASAFGVMGTGALAQGTAPFTPLQLEAIDIIAASTIDGGFAPDMAIAIGECFGGNMTDAEAAAFIAAEGFEAQQEITNGIAAHDAALLCTVEAMQ